MSNNLIISDFANPVYIFDINTPSTISEKGVVYDITTGSVSVAPSSFLVLQLTIPANINKTIYIGRIAGGATANILFDILRNASFSASGTAVTPINNNWDYGSNSGCTAKYISQGTDPTTGGNLLISFIQPSGGGLILVPFDGRIVIPSSSSALYFTLRLANTSNQANPCSISLAY